MVENPIKFKRLLVRVILIGRTWKRVWVSPRRDRNGEESFGRLASLLQIRSRTMKKQFKTSVFFLIPLILITLISTPQVASASWWNPFTWFKKEIKVEQAITPPQQVPISKQENTEHKKEEIKIVSKSAESKKVIPETTTPIQIPPAVIPPIVIPPKENYKLEDVVKAWRPYTVRVTCITLDSNGNKKSYSDGSGFLTIDPAKGPTIFTNKHVFYTTNGASSDYCDVYFPESKEVVKVEKKDRYVSSKGYDRGTLVITQPSEYVSNLVKNKKITVNDCIRANAESTDDIVIMGYPMGKPKDDISYAQGKIDGYQDKYFVSTATIVSGYSGGVAVSLKDNCYLGIPTYSQKDDLSKSLILDINKF